jgi:hypothetical protein
MNLPKDIPDLERQVNLQGVLAVAVISGCPFATAKKAKLIYDMAAAFSIQENGKRIGLELPHVNHKFS